MSLFVVPSQRIIEDWDEFVCCAFAKNYQGLMLMMMMQWNVEKSLRQ
jgi:hypothetical protein